MITKLKLVGEDGFIHANLEWKPEYEPYKIIRYHERVYTFHNFQLEEQAIFYEEQKQPLYLG